MRDGERKKHGGGARQVDGRDTSAWPKNWLVAVTLLVLREQGAYGYALMERMGAFGLGEINPGTLYRTLRQMDKEGLCKSEWETFEGGPACRMYSITDTGSSYLDSWAESLGRCERMVDAFFSIYLEGPTADGNGGRDGDEGEEDSDGQIRLAPETFSRRGRSREKAPRAPYPARSGVLTGSRAASVQLQGRGANVLRLVHAADGW